MSVEITWLALGQSILMAIAILAIGWLVSKWAHLLILSAARGRLRPHDVEVASLHVIYIELAPSMEGLTLLQSTVILQGRPPNTP